jgi:competence protein ComEA
MGRRRAEDRARVRQRLREVFGREVFGREAFGREAFGRGDLGRDGFERVGPDSPESPDNAPDRPPDDVPISPAAAFDPGRRGLRALAVVAAVVVCVAAVLAWQARPRLEAVDSPAPSSPASAAPQASAPAAVVVAVSGRVRRPGLVRLPAGARVADAIEAAGGVLPDTDLSLVNLARKVSDGELIAIGIASPGGVPGDGSAPTGATGAGKVNLNTATLAELDALPGVGPVLAQRILDHRQRHGGFRSVSELGQVDGIGDARYQELKDLVTV